MGLTRRQCQQPLLGRTERLIISERCDAADQCSMRAAVTTFQASLGPSELHTASCPATLGYPMLARLVCRTATGPGDSTRLTSTQQAAGPFQSSSPDSCWSTDWCAATVRGDALLACPFCAGQPSKPAALRAMPCTVYRAVLSKCGRVCGSTCSLPSVQGRCANVSVLALRSRTFQHTVLHSGLVGRLAG